MSTPPGNAGPPNLYPDIAVIPYTGNDSELSAWAVVQARIDVGLQDLPKQEWVEWYAEDSVVPISPEGVVAGIINPQLRHARQEAVLQAADGIVDAYRVARIGDVYAGYMHTRVSSLLPFARRRRLGRITTRLVLEEVYADPTEGDPQKIVDAMVFAALRERRHITVTLSTPVGGSTMADWATRHGFSHADGEEIDTELLRGRQVRTLAWTAPAARVLASLVEHAQSDRPAPAADLSNVVDFVKERKRRRPQADR